MREILKQLMEAPVELQEFVISEAKEYLRLCEEHRLSCEDELSRKKYLLDSWDSGFEVDFCESKPEHMEVKISLSDYDDEYHIHIPYNFFFNREKWLQGQIDWTRRVNAVRIEREKAAESRRREYEMKQLRELQAKYPHISHDSE